jgi:hypothetical protein
MMDPCRPPLPPNRPYRWPLNYPKYVKDSNLDAHDKVFKATVRTNGETEHAEIVNLFSFTLKDTMFNWCNNYMGTYPNCIFA